MRPGPRRAASGLALVGVLGLVLLLWPARLGGATTFVSTHGVSMEPRFHTGDLAVVREAEHYAVGDVAAYHSTMFRTVVLHRIVGVERGRYTLQGDNNSWLDPERPTQDQLVGKLAVRIPRGGAWRERLTSPVGLGLRAFLLLAGGTTARNRHSRRRTTVSQHAARASRRGWATTGLPPRATSTAATAAAVGVLGVALGVAAWTSPGSEPVVEPASPQSMTFSYRATVPVTPAYDDTTVTAPDPVFRRVVDRVRVGYTYHGAPGRIAVTAELSTAGGWHSTVPLSRPAPVDGERSTGSVTLELSELQRRAEAAARVTGIPVGQVDVTVVPTVTTAGDEPFTPGLDFVLTPLQLTMVGDASSLVVAEPVAAETGPHPGPAVEIAGRQVPLGAARALSLVMVLGALVAAGLIGLFAHRTSPTSEGAAIRRRYAGRLVAVQPMSTPAGRPVVDVVDFATLARLAERYELLVLHWSRSDVETFVVQDHATTYRYRTGTSAATVSNELDAAAV